MVEGPSPHFYMEAGITLAQQQEAPWDLPEAAPPLWVQGPSCWLGTSEDPSGREHGGASTDKVIYQPWSISLWGLPGYPKGVSVITG